jgi:drug/metabolite transporter (DMT)-like permease
MILRFLLLVLGVFACSTAVILIKESGIHAVLLSSYRQLVAAAALTPLFIRDYRRHRDTLTRADLRASILPGVVLGLHFISWIIGSRMTSSVNATLIVNLVPMAMPFFLFFMIRERLTRNEWIATFLALIGLLVLSGASYRVDRDRFWGDMLCLLSMLFFACYLALGRKNRHVVTVWLYVVPLYTIGGLFCFAVSLFFTTPIRSYPPKEIALILALGIIPTVVGHSILNHSMKHLRGQVVSITNMGQFVFAGIMAFFILREIPAWTFYVAGVILVAAAWLAIKDQPGESRP